MSEQIGLKKGLLTVVLLLAFAVLIQCIFLIKMPEKERFKLPNDFKNIYHPLAVNLLEGKGYTDENGRFVTICPPGYVLMMAGIYAGADYFHADRVHMIVYVNMLWMSLSALTVFLLAWTTLKFSIGVLSAVLWITYPFNLWLMKQPSTEAPFLFFFLFSVFLLFLIFKRLHFIYAIGAGVLLGLSALIRPVVVFLPLVYAFIILFKKSLLFKRRVVFLLTLLAGFFFTVLPWEIKVAQKTGEWMYLCSNGPYSMLDGIRFVFRGGIHGERLQLDQSLLDLMRRAEAGKEELKSTGKIIGFLKEEWEKDPSTVLKLGLLKFGRSWWGTDQMRMENYIVLCQLAYLICALLGLWGSRSSFEGSWFYISSFGVLIIYFWMMTFLVLSIVRYMIPAMTFIIIFVAMLGDKLMCNWKKRVIHS
jgi:4-amino-4-deoxy-L-arabinose transferase-like glycosyltransferase